jgi:hypothetical protein
MSFDHKFGNEQPHQNTPGQSSFATDTYTTSQAVPGPVATETVTTETVKDVDPKVQAEHERKEALRAKDSRVHPKLKQSFDKTELKEHLSVQTFEDLKCFYIWIHEQQPGLVKRFNKVRHNIL